MFIGIIKVNVFHNVQSHIILSLFREILQTLCTINIVFIVAYLNVTWIYILAIYKDGDISIQILDIPKICSAIETCRETSSCTVGDIYNKLSVTVRVDIDTCNRFPSHVAACLAATKRQSSILTTFSPSVASS